MSLQPGHRHGSFKQKNKLHKSKHRSKRALTASGIKAKRVARPSCKKAQRLRKSCRRVKNKDKQKAKQSFLKDHKRFSILADIPIILTLFGISNRCPSELAINFLQEHYPMSTVGTNGCSYQLKIPKIRNTFQILVPNADVSLPCIDAIKVSESVLIVCNANDSIDDINEKLMELITLNCVQKCYVLIQGLRDLSPAQRRQQHQHLSSIFKPCLSKCNICSFDNPNDVFSLLQRICQNKPVHMPAREGRPYIVSEQCHLNLLDNELSITGIVRGNQLSINGLMYIPGVGSCQIKQIELIKPIDGEVGSVIFPDVNEQVKLPSYEPPNAPEPIKKSVVFNDSSSIEHVFVPEGTSDYQATWLQYPLEEDESSSIVDASVGSCVDEDDIDDEDLPMTIDDNRSESAFSTDSTKLKRQVTFADNVIFNNTDDESEMQSIDGRDMSYLKNARLELKDYNEISSFSNQTDTELPSEYAYLHHFEDYRNAVKFLRKNEVKKVYQVEMGSKVNVTFCKIPRLSSEKLNENILCAYGLYPHEEKMSLCNILLNRSISSIQMLKSNQKLIFVAGIRRFSASAIFSEIKNATKFKCQESFPPGSTLMASIYAPIMLTPCPVIVLTKYIDGSLHLVASGHLVSCDVNRINLERVILRGKPYKINGRKAVVRGMFSNPEDINYFKAFPISSKCGRKGKILESLGTKGYMKCQFDRPLKSQDVVMMPLYKRVFPKWDFADMNDYSL